MTTVGLIGSGHIGSTVARLAVDAGHDVVLSNSRGPETLRGLVAELGPRARAATREGAAAAGDIVVVSLPVKAYPTIASAPLAGKAVLDTGNYYPARDGQIPEIDDGRFFDSQYLREQLTGAEVARVTELGATVLTPSPVTEGGWTWHILADPDGNEFCVLRPPPEYW